MGKEANKLEHLIGSFWVDTAASVTGEASMLSTEEAQNSNPNTQAKAFGASELRFFNREYSVMQYLLLH